MSAQSIVKHLARIGDNEMKQRAYEQERREWRAGHPEREYGK